MAVKYALFENNMTSDPNDYMAVVQPEASKTMDDIIAMMTNRGSTATKAEVLSIMEEFSLALTNILKDGGSINFPLFNVSFSITGVFNGPDDSFDSMRHQLRINVSPGLRLKESEGSIKTEKVKADKPMPVLIDFKDIASDSRNQNLTPGGVGNIKGSLLSFDPADPAQGIFIIAESGTETKATTLIRHKPGELIFMIPSGISAGTYRLEVRSNLRNGKQIRTGALPFSLTV